MKLVFMGTPEFAAPTLKALREAGHTIGLAVSQPDRPAGRGKKTSPTPVKNEAERLGIEVFQPENVNAPESIEKISSVKPDAIVVVAFGQILKKKLLAIPSLGCLNLHGSLLPKLRGAAPMQRAIMERHAVTGITTMKMARKMDAGDVYLKDEVAIGPTMILGELHDILAEKGASLMVKTINLLEKGELAATPQEESLVTYAPKILPEERLINWNSSAEEIDAKIRGLSPVPGAYSFFNGKRTLFLRSGVSDAGSGGFSPGKVSLNKTGCLEVDTGNGRLGVYEIRPEGKKAVSAASWANGARLNDDSCFISERNN